MINNCVLDIDQHNWDYYLGHNCAVFLILQLKLITDDHRFGDDQTEMKIPRKYWC